jgi:cytochrome c(L)
MRSVMRGDEQSPRPPDVDQARMIAMTARGALARRVRLLAVLSVVASLVVGLAVVADEPLKNPYTGDAQAIEEGHQLFLDSGCYACHGHHAEGGMGPSLTGAGNRWIYKPTDTTLFRTISNGREGTNMAPWKDTLSPDQIWKIIAFIRSLYQGDPAKVVW